jgi:SET domain-containing protein
MGKSKSSKDKKKKTDKKKLDKKKAKPDRGKNWNGPEPRLDEKMCGFKLRLGKSAIHRWGVFAEEKIPAKKKVIEYTGERISRKETKRRAEAPFNYLFTLDKYWTIDGAVGGSGAEFINHSCDPNCFSQIVHGHILYKAKRTIKKGEELTVDYRFDADVEDVPCSCGSKKCRGTINLKK